MMGVQPSQPDSLSSKDYLMIGRPCNFNRFEFQYGNNKRNIMCLVNQRRVERCERSPALVLMPGITLYE